MIRSDVIDKRDHGQARLLLFQVEVGGALEQSESHVRSLSLVWIRETNDNELRTREREG